MCFRSVILTLLIAGCGPTSGELAPGRDLGGDAQVSLDGGDGADLTVSFPRDFSAICPSQILCGPLGLCCEAGQECVDDACVAECATGIRCGAAGSTCCAAGQVCLAQICVLPRGICADSLDCNEDEFCEPSLSRCLPQPGSIDGGVAGMLCEYRPPVLPYAPTLEWSWTSSTILSTYVQVIHTPLVMDVDKDAVPDVLIVTSVGYDDLDPAVLRLLDGKTGAEKWPATAGVYQAGNRTSARGTPAIADLDGNGSLEIVAPKEDGGLIAFNAADGSFLWRSKNADNTDYNTNMNSPVVAIADMDGDGNAEIVVGGVIFDRNGVVLRGAGREFAGTNRTGYGAVSIIADVNEDGTMEVLTGRAAFALNGGTLWDCTVMGTSNYCGFGAAPADGYTAISDLDNDGTPELIVIAGGNVRVQNARTGARLTANHDMPGTGSGGPPTVADFDGDGKMDISSANGTSYNVFGYTPSPSPAVIDKWQSATQDGSSNVTGSSVFDFEGDGKAEVVYNDECYFRVYRGSDGMTLFQTPSSSATIHEYPILVDVDGDNRTEVVVASNDANHLNGPPPSVTCAGYTAGQAPRHGVFVYGDSNNKWVRTRKLWNQHAYHITSIESDGKLPRPEPHSWKSFNNYRVSAQGKGVFNAPDLAVDVEVSTATCPDALAIRARVKNVGSLGVAAGVKVEFYLGSDANGMKIGTAQTQRALLPGGSELVTMPFAPTGSPPYQFYIVVDGGAAAGASRIDECNEANNAAGTAEVVCPIVL